MSLDPVVTVISTSPLLAYGEHQQHLIDVCAQLYSILRPCKPTDLITRVNIMVF